MLGYGSKADGTADTDLPIYEYVIENPITSSLGQNLVPDAPLVLLTSGIHSDEKTSMMALYNFVSSLFDSDNENALAIRSALRFKIVPCINPWGYDHTTDQNEGRLNARGVNLNRNFSYRWSSYTGSDKGSAPYSELETQALKDWLDANTNALFYLDCHNSAYAYPYLPSNVPNHKKLWCSTLRMLCNYLATTYNLSYSNTSRITEANNIAGVAAEGYEVCGIDSGIIESPYGSGTVISTTKIKPESEIYGNFIIELIKNYRI